MYWSFTKSFLLLYLFLGSMDASFCNPLFQTDELLIGPLRMLILLCPKTIAFSWKSPKSQVYKYEIVQIL